MLWWILAKIYLLCDPMRTCHSALASESALKLYYFIFKKMFLSFWDDPRKLEPRLYHLTGSECLGPERSGLKKKTLPDTYLKRTPALANRVPRLNLTGDCSHLMLVFQISCQVLNIKRSTNDLGQRQRQWQKSDSTLVFMWPLPDLIAFWFPVCTPETPLSTERAKDKQSQHHGTAPDLGSASDGYGSAKDATCITMVSAKFNSLLQNTTI
jgi:hypothetical protein